MKGFRFLEYSSSGRERSTFDQLREIFLELMVHTAGDVAEALNWLTTLDQKYNLTSDDYGIGDFVEELREKGYIREEEDGFVPGARSDREIRQNSLEQIFGKLRRGKKGQHRTSYSGLGEETGTDKRPYRFGDTLEQISMTDSLKNAQIRTGIGRFELAEEDLEVQEKEFQTLCSTVLMIDISHSMILYGEDRITPAKKTAMALAELIRTRYPKDTLDIIVFGNDAWQVQLKDLPYLEVGPYHTNTVAGLELAMDLLRRKKNPNKQIFMITDGKPTCIKEGAGYYKNSFGLDRKIVNKTLNLAGQARRLKIPVTTFMIATDPWLQAFVREFTEVNNGRAFYSDLEGLGEYIFEDFTRNRRNKSR